MPCPMSEVKRTHAMDAALVVPVSAADFTIAKALAGTILVSHLGEARTQNNRTIRRMA